MKRHILILSFFILAIQFIACSPKDLWENYFDSTDVSSVRAVSNTNVEIIFKGEVEQTSAETSTNYTINGLTVTSANRDASDFTKVLLATSSQQDIEYSLIIKDVKMTNNKIVDTTNDPNEFMGSPLFGIVNVIATSITGVDVEFSKEIEPTDAEAILNYSIPGLEILAAEYDSSRTVHLTTSTQSYITYTLTVTNITDIDSNNIEPSMSSMDFWGYLFRVSKVTTVNNTLVNVTFTNDVELTSSQIPGNYNITKGVDVLNVNTATRDSTNLKLVHLETGSQVQGTYTLIASNIKSVINEDISSMPVTFEGDALPCITLAKSTSNTSVQVTFSENVGNGSNDPAHYIISGGSGCTVTSANVSGKIVDLVTSEQSEGVLYTLTINFVYDTSTSPNLIVAPGNTYYPLVGDGRPEINDAYWVVIVDFTGPPSLALNHFRAFFSEPVNADDASDPGNYSITYIPTSSPLNVTSVTWVNDSTYELTTDQQVDGTSNYSISAVNIHDLSGNNNLANSIVFNGKHCPYIDRIDPVASFPSMIDITFSEVMNSGICIPLDNFRINGSIATAAALSGDFQVVRVTMPFDFVTSTDYTLTVYNVTDGTGNVIQASNLDIYSAYTPGNVYEFTFLP